MERWNPVRFAALVAVGLICECAIVSDAAKVGDVGTGWIAQEDANSLTLQANPCDQNSAVMTFSFPWKKRAKGKKNCSDRSYDLYQIEQLPPKDQNPGARGADGKQDEPQKGPDEKKRSDEPQKGPQDVPPHEKE